MKKKIYFIEKTIPFSSLDFNKPIISGSEKTLINITNELAKNNELEVKVFNLTNENKIINKVEWKNLNHISDEDNPDVLISMSDSNLLSMFKCKKNYLWSHSVQPIEKFIRKKQFFSFIKNRPVMILESKYHFETRSWFTSLYGKIILPIAVDYDFINHKIENNYIPENNAIFTTRSDRNMKFLLNAWSKINLKVNNSKLYINPPYNLSDDDKKMSVKLRTKGSKSDLINDLVKSKLMLNPGHKGEVFCLAAEEARELCLPIVTMGYGSLNERVEHGVTGYIAKNENEFVNYSINILNDKNLYLNLRQNLFKRRNSRSYKDVAKDLINIINEN